MITFDHVSYSYPGSETAAIDDLSINIKAGEAVCAMGANGSGKSTFACLLAGLYQPNRGTIRIDGDKKIPVGIIFQNPDNQMVAVTVEKELAFALENLCVPAPKIEPRISETLAGFSASHLSRRLTSELSGGEKQRVALSSVMIYNPPVLILDEPDSFLDEAGRRLLNDEIARLRAEQPEMILIRITQYRYVAGSYERLLVFGDGQLVADGRPDEIFSQSTFCRKAGLRFDRDREKTASWPEIERQGAKALTRISAEAITFAYPSREPIFKNLSLELNLSEITGVVGPTGSGKSTLGLLISGVLANYSGVLRFSSSDGDLLTVDDKRGRIAGLFQQPEKQFFLPTCYEEIAFGPLNFGFSLSDKQIRQMLAFVGLDPDRFTGRDPITLSMGEKRRLAFAAVLSMDPDFIIFDEPTCGLDPEGVGRFMTMVLNLKQEGKGIVLISHDGDLLESLCGQILSLADQPAQLKPAPDFFILPDSRRLLHFQDS